jgi:membrane protease YdiL (CAAX protease family)
MERVGNTIERRGLLIFLLTTFVLSWMPVIIGGRNSGLLPLGPSIAALLVIGLGSGLAGLRNFVKRCFNIRNIRPVLWVGSLLVPILVVSSAAVVVIIGGGAWQSEKVNELWPQALANAPVVLLFIALGEEPGWRGFLQPELQSRYRPIVSAIIIWAVWGLWHVPLLGTEMELSTVPPFLLCLLGATFFSAWLTNAARGSVIPVMLFHTAVNCVGGAFFFQQFKGPDLAALWWMFACFWLVVGLAVVWQTGGQLGFLESQAIPRGPRAEQDAP